ncbi:MAG: S41 family peptidase [Flavobacterium sp.]
MRRLYKFLSIPDTLLPYLKTWNQEFKEPKKENDYLKVNGYYEKRDTLNLPCIPTNPKTNSYKGEVFLITNANNSSTTFTMADIFKNYSFGKIVGEPTGGTKQGLNGGQMFFLCLPFSKFEIDLPIIFQAPTENSLDEAVNPDYLITTKQSDIFYNRDSQIEFIFKKIRR